MKKVLNASEKLFFNVLIICLISYIYFTILPINEVTLILGTIFCVFYFGCNFYTGYKYSFNILQAILVGLAGCGIGIFLAFFALYAQIVLKDTTFAIWLISPYIMPTLSIVKIFSTPINLDYSFILMFINILLVIIGSYSKKIMNKFFTIFKVL